MTTISLSKRAVQENLRLDRHLSEHLPRHESEADSARRVRTRRTDHHRSDDVKNTMHTSYTTLRVSPCCGACPAPIKHLTRHAVPVSHIPGKLLPKCGVPEAIAVCTNVHSGHIERGSHMWKPLCLHIEHNERPFCRHRPPVLTVNLTSYLSNPCCRSAVLSFSSCTGSIGESGMRSGPV